MASDQGPVGGRGTIWMFVKTGKRPSRASMKALMERGINDWVCWQIPERAWQALRDLQ